VTSTNSALGRITDRVAQHRRGLLLAGGALAAAVAVVVFLQSLPVTYFDPDTVGVWVTDRGSASPRVGRLNTRTGEIDSIASVAELVEVRQDGSTAWIVTGTAGGDRTATPVRPGERPEGAENDRPGAIRLAAGEQFRVGGGTAATLSPRRLNVIRDSAGDAPTTEAFPLEDDEGSTLEVGVDGTVAVWLPGPGALAVLEPGAADLRTTDVEEPPGDAELTLVGSSPVLLDRADERVWTESGWQRVRTGTRLQLPGPARDVVVVSDPEGLSHARLDGGAPPEQVAPAGPAAGDPKRPAVDGSCDHGAWAGAPPLAHCPDSEPVRGPDDARAGADLDGFTVGRPTGVLNLPERAKACAVIGSDEPAWVCAAFPPPDDRVAESELLQLDPPDFEANDPPVAEPDPELRARQRGSAPLNVLANDWDRDRDPLAVTFAEPVDPGFRDLFSVRAGRLLLRASDLTPGTRIPFTYRISDGIDEAEASAAVTIVDDTVNSGPELIGPDPVTVAIPVSRTTGVDVVGRFVDPEGDPVVLAPVERADTQLRAVAERPSGFLQLTAATPLRERVAARVIDVPPDGAGAAGAQVTFEVVAESSARPPTTNGDVQVVTPGQTNVRVDVLANDVDPDQEPGTLTLDEDGFEPTRGPLLSTGDLRVEDDEERGRQVVEFDVPATAEPGQTANITYTAVGGSGQTARGKLVVTVEASTAGEPVIVRNDVAIIDTRHSTLVDLLRNDEVAGTPDALLAIGEVTAPGGPGATRPKVAVNPDLRTAYVDPASAEANRSYRFTYCVIRSKVDDCRSNTAELTVLVEPGRPDRPAVARQPAPTVTVAGESVGHIALSQLIENPDGEPVVFQRPSRPDDGRSAFVDGATLRFDARGTPAGGPPVRVDVPVARPDGTPFVATAQFSVVDAPALPPPPSLEARVQAGRSISIPVPIDAPREVGSIGPTPGPQDGSRYARIDTERRSILFEAPPTEALGVDRQVEFTYRVVDARTGTPEQTAGRVRVLITPTGGPAARPVARDDRIRVGPSGTAWLDPLANDTIISGDPLRLGELDANGCSAETVQDAGGGRSLVRVSGVGAAECTVGYQVFDPANASDRATIRAERPAGFPGSPPVLRDDVARPEGRSSVVSVDVLANDEDPDGRTDDLDLRPPEGTELDGRSIRVTLTDEPQILRYTAVDDDGLEATAFVFVPPRGVDQPLRLRPGREVVMIRPDRAPVEVNLEDLVEDPDGDPWEPTAVDPGTEFTPVPVARSFSLSLNPASERASGERRLQVTFSSAETTVVIGIPVRIEPKENVPPTWIRQIACPPIPEDEEIPPIDVGSLLFDPDPSPTYRIEVQPSGSATAEVNGTSITVRAVKGAPKGSGYSLSVTATNEDGRPSPTGPTQCTGSLVGTSTNPPTVVAALSGPLREGSGPVSLAQDQVVRQDSRVSRPIERMAVTGIATTAQSKGRPAECSSSGSSLTITPIAKGGGSVVCNISVTDGFGRTVAGSLQVDVQGAPDPPTGASATPVEAGSAADVAFTPGSNNFGGETSYTISAGSGGPSTQCSGPPCTVGNLTNGRTYSFSITATNDIGASTTPVTTNAVTPEVAPDPPVVNLVEEGDGSASFSWSATSRSESVTRFEVDGVTGSSTSTTKPGKNGEQVCVTVVATNEGTSRGGGGKRSEPVEQCGVPYGAPLIDSFVLTAGAGDGTVRADWMIRDNGRPLTSTPAIDLCGSSITASGGSAECPVGIEVTATLTVENPRGSESRSASATPYRPPTITCANSTVTRSSTPREQPEVEGCDATDNGTGLGDITYTRLSPFTDSVLEATVCGTRVNACSTARVAEGVFVWDTPTIPAYSPRDNAPGEYTFDFDDRVRSPYALVNTLNDQQVGRNQDLTEGEYELKSCLFEDGDELACSTTSFAVTAATTTTTTTTPTGPS
jgi:hypothetical protein